MAFLRDDRQFKAINRPERIGNSDIFVLPHPNRGAGRIRIPMPPSCNQRQRPAYGRGRRLDGRATLRLALTEEAVGFLACAPVLRMAWKRIMQWPLEDYAPFIFHFYLSNMAYDTHNGLKLACDLLQKSGLILNDRFILPQVAMPVHAPADPRLVIDFPVAAGNGPPQEDVTR